MVQGTSFENDLNALALLALVASGREEYRPLVAEYAQKVAECQPGPGFPESWEYAYNTLFLAEYALATKDEAVMAGLRRSALAIACGASGVGTWGHRFAQPNGNLYGYGCMNQPGIPLTLAMVLAREAGVKDPDLDKTSARASGFLRQWVNRGAIPYGDHEPWPWHDDNGKCSGAAVLFDRLGDREAAAFYSRMGTAAYAERESGHTGNFFNILWALPGVSRGGPAATAAYFKETSWYCDLARGWDGRCEYVGFPGEDSYDGWDCTGACLLGYALPLKSLYLTGRRPGAAPVLSPTDVAETIAAGRGFTFQNAERKVWYAERKSETLLAGLSSWSPAVRTRSSQKPRSTSRASTWAASARVRRSPLASRAPWRRSPHSSASAGDSSSPSGWSAAPRASSACSPAAVSRKRRTSAVRSAGGRPSRSASPGGAW